MKPFLRHLTDVEIEARIATRLAALTAEVTALTERVRQLEDGLEIVGTATEALVFEHLTDDDPPKLKTVHKKERPPWKPRSASDSSPA